jgi:hypothetical protein
LLHDTLSMAELLRGKRDPTIAKLKVVVAGEQPTIRSPSGLAIPTTARLDELDAAGIVVLPALGACDEDGVLAAPSAPATVRLIVALGATAPAPTDHPRRADHAPAGCDGTASPALSHTVACRVLHATNEVAKQRRSLPGISPDASARVAVRGAPAPDDERASWLGHTRRSLRTTDESQVLFRVCRLVFGHGIGRGGLPEGRRSLPAAAVRAGRRAEWRDCGRFGVGGLDAGVCGRAAGRRVRL